MANSAIPFRSISGTFYRAIDPEFREFAIAGSRSAGRYSRASEPTLYLSSTAEGVEAAMIAHRDARSASLKIIPIQVDASCLFDLRNADALTAAGIDRAAAAAPWQEAAASGGVPPSWRVRDRLIAAGASGLIDPSRRRPDLWHLVLFRWNEPGAPTVRWTLDQRDDI